MLWIVALMHSKNKNLLHYTTIPNDELAIFLSPDFIEVQHILQKVVISYVLTLRSSFLIFRQKKKKA